ncbi:DUF222 domain-containing protein [Kocuria sp. CH-021]|uniref:HNH endonuclease signature motif containing protein n=1 Tax=Kocuria sp. CH-021 TaxID=3406735 RepID=UPI003C724324
MTITAGRPWNREGTLREDRTAAGFDREYAGAVAELVGDARAEARAAGRQLRTIHRMWQLQEQAHEQQQTDRARRCHQRARGRGQDLPEPEKRTVLDVADEIGPALRLPAGTAVRRVENAILLAESLPRVLQALEAGTIALRQAEVIVDLWRDVVDGAGRVPEQRAAGEAVARVADELLEKAPAVTAAQLRALARRRRARLLAGSEEARHRAAHRGRRVWVEPEEDGMARLCALLDAATAHAVQHRLVSIAARVDPHSPPPDGPGAAGDGPCGGKDLDPGHGEGGRRTAGQLRADVLASLLLDGEPTWMPEHLRGIRGQVTVTVPVLALLERSAQTPDDGHPSGSPGTGRGPRNEHPGGSPITGGHARDGRSDGSADTGGDPRNEHPGWSPTTAGHPRDGHSSGSFDTGGGPCAGDPPGATDCAELAGYGPIPVSVAERIAAGAGSWSRVLTHPVTGTVLDHDRTTYAVPADLRRRLRARDGTCRFPGCRRRAERCDLDHTVAWVDGGRTAADNLAHLCRHHHVLKHRHGPLGRWQVRHRHPRTPEGVLEWTSPAGRVHVTYPQEHHHPVLTPLRILDDLRIDPRPPCGSPRSEPPPLSGPPTAGPPLSGPPSAGPPPLSGPPTARPPSAEAPWTFRGPVSSCGPRPHDDPPPF